MSGEIIESTRFRELALSDQVIAKSIKNSELSLTDINYQNGQACGKKLVDEGVRDLENHIMQGEKESLRAILKGIVIGRAGIAVSPFGSGKSELLAVLPRLITDMDVVSIVPDRDDVTAAELVGKSQSVIHRERLIDDEDVRGLPKSLVEKILESKQEPIVRPDTQVLLVDEATRKRQRTLASLLGMIAGNHTYAREGAVPLDSFEFGMFLANPNERKMVVERLPAALADRMMFGAILGEEENWDAVLVGTVDEESEPEPEKIKPLISLAKLHLARLAVKAVMIPDSSKFYIKQVTKETLRALRSLEEPYSYLGGYMEPHIAGPGRLSKHLMLNARAEAFFDNRFSVEASDVNNGLHGKLMGVLAASGVSSLEEIQKTTELIQTRVENSL